MVAIKNSTRKLLAAPAAIILLYAADGWALRHQMLSHTGKPRTPERTIWVPLFRQLVETHEGLGELKEFATAGMRGWNCPAVYLECLDAAFCDICFRSRVIAALHDLADTAREKFPLQEPIPAAKPASDMNAHKAKPSSLSESRRRKRKRMPGFEP
jgi:hypothetical protein